MQNKRADVVAFNVTDFGILSVRLAEDAKDAFAQLADEFIRIMREESADGTITISEQKDCYGEKIYFVKHDDTVGIAYKVMFENDKEPGICTDGIE